MEHHDLNDHKTIGSDILAYFGMSVLAATIIISFVVVVISANKPNPDTKYMCFEDGELVYQSGSRPTHITGTSRWFGGGKEFPANMCVCNDCIGF